MQTYLAQTLNRLGSVWVEKASPCGCRCLRAQSLIIWQKCLSLDVKSKKTHGFCKSKHLVQNNQSTSGLTEPRALTPATGSDRWECVKILNENIILKIIFICRGIWSLWVFFLSVRGLGRGQGLGFCGSCRGLRFVTNQENFNHHSTEKHLSSCTAGRLKPNHLETLCGNPTKLSKLETT